MTATIAATTVALTPLCAWGQTGGNQTQPSIVASPDVNAYFDGLARTVRTASPAQRFDAAQRLVESHHSYARDLLTQLLSASDDRAQYACARAMAEASLPDGRWISPLTLLLPRERSLSEVAARALARFDGSPNAYGELIRVARSGPPANRLGAITALGRVVQKDVAQNLVAIISDQSQPPELRIAAGNSLSKLSGQAPSGDSASFWSAWIAARSEAPIAWRTRVVNEQHGTLQAAEGLYQDRLSQLRADINYRELHRYTDEPQLNRKKAMLTELLTDPDPDLRAAGAYVALDAINGVQQLDNNIKSRLFELVGDPSPEVRRGVANVLTRLGANANAFNVIRLQLEIETDLSIKTLLIKALSRADDQAAIPVLEKLISQSSPPVAAAAADALRSSPSIQNNLESAQTEMKFLSKVLDDRTTSNGQPSSDPEVVDLRAHLVLAIAGMAAKQPTSEIVVKLWGYTSPNEPLQVRQAAFTGLGSLGRAAADVVGDQIQRELNPNVEPEPAIRAAAVRALGNMGQFIYFGDIDARTNPANEPSSEVQAAAREAASQLLSYGTVQQIAPYAGDFKRRGDYERAVEALNVLSSKLTGPDSQMDFALRQQEIAEIYADKLKQPAQAISYFNAALDYYEKHKFTQARIDLPMRELLDAYLAAGQYEDALTFSREQIERDPSAEETIGSELANFADGLAKSATTPESAARARQFITLALQRKASGQLSIDDLRADRMNMALASLPAAPTTNPAH